MSGKVDQQSAKAGIDGDRFSAKPPEKPKFQVDLVSSPSHLPAMTQTFELIDQYLDSLHQEVYFPQYDLHDTSGMDTSDCDADTRSDSPGACRIASDILTTDAPLSTDSLDELQIALASYEPDSAFEMERRIADELLNIRHLIQ